MHRDLKLENILLDKDCRPKLADFGFSREISPNSTLSTYCGSPLYASPEMIFAKPYRGPECDVWSLGVIFYCMLTANMPFDDSNPTKFLQVIQKGHYTPPASASESARDLISKMLDPNPRSRATVGDIMSHPWVRCEGRRRSVNPQQQQRQRKVNLCYSQSEAAEIAAAVVKMAASTDVQVKVTVPGEHLCQCACHEEGMREPGDRKDSVLVQAHCESCSLHSATATLMMHRNRSNCSSGYGSESGSTVFAPRLSVAYADGPANTRRRSQPSPKRESRVARSSLVVPPSFMQCHQTYSGNSDDLVFV